MDESRRGSNPPRRSKLEGSRVSLIPLESSHLDALWAVADDPSIWEWNPWPIASKQDMAAYVSKAVAEFKRGDSMPFVTVDNSTRQIIGSTRYMHIVSNHRRLEIGCTWIGPKWQRTGINREAKLLMLENAFDVLGYERVELKTDMMNVQSRTAIARLGAKEEGILRRHMVTKSGRFRDTVYFSILSAEWPSIREKLIEQQR